jgi:L-2-hydroxyglutarate oxidase
MTTTINDIVVIGGGIVGLASALAFAEKPGRKIVVLEAESGLARHQTGNNSGVIHSGLYYKPGSLKAKNCATGRDAMYRFCADNGIAHDNCGKLVVAIDKSEIGALTELERRGKANGLAGVKLLGAEQLKEYEPNVAGVAGLWVPETGIADYKKVAQVMAEKLTASGAEIRTDARVRSVERRDQTFVVQAGEHEIHARNLINCAGLQCDRVASLCGMTPTVRIVPFRGEYYKLNDDKSHLVRNLIYPVPDSRFPFLGVHFTRMIAGGVEAGPNAVLALKREGYGRLSFSPRDAANSLTYSGFWRMASRYWKTGMGEVWRSFSKPAFVRALQRLMPVINSSDLHRHGAGVRAQAVGPDGKLVDDFHIMEADRMLHVLNAPSPGATASLSIGRALAAQAAVVFQM